MSLEGLNPIIIIQKYKDLYVYKNKETIKQTNKSITTKNEISAYRESTNLLSSFKKWGEIDIDKSKFNIPDGLPIVFTLCSQMDLIVVNQELNKSTNIEYDEKLKVQSQLKNSMTIQLEAKTGSVFTSAIIGLLQWCWDNTQLYNYTISYFNDNFVVMQGHLGDFSCKKSNKNGWYDISITLDSGLNPKDKIVKEKEEKDGAKGNLYFKSSQSKVINV